nr:AraC family transcriptional regulator [Mesorhizobium loti]
MTSGSIPMQRLSTEAVQPRCRLAFVHDFIARHVGGLHFHPADSANVKIDLEAMHLPGGLTVGLGQYAPMRGARTRELLQDGREHYLLTIHGEDHEMSVDGGKPVTVRAGDLLLINEARAFEFRLHRPVDIEVISLDRQALARLAPLVDMEPSYIVPAETPHSRLLAHYANMIRRDAPRTKKAGEVASRHIYDLAALVLDGFVRGGAERNETSITAARLKLVKQDIADRLVEAGLNIDAVARRQGVSPRYIQRLFESEGTTFSDFVRAGRLDLAFRLLADREHVRTAIAAIAYEAGFSDVSAFNRAFRQRFGVTPSEIRASILVR